jgi:hypothetical protein
MPSKVVQFEGDSILGSYLQLPALPKDLRGNLGREFFERFTQSRLAHAVDSAADDSDGLPSIPDTATGYAHFGFISRESFNTAVQDLVQQYPDTPIGGKGAAPMKRPSNVGTLAINGSSIYMGAPQFDASSPPHILDHDNGSEKALRARNNFSSNFSDSSHEPNEFMAQPNSSASTPAMITAPQSPKAGRRNGMISFAVDGPGGGRTEVRDFAQQSELTQISGSPPLPDCCVSPRSIVSDICIYANMDKRGANENLPGAPYSTLGPVPEFTLDKAKAPAAGMSAVPISNGAIGAGAPNAQGVTAIIEEVGSKGVGAPDLPQVPAAIEEVGTQKLNAPLDIAQVSYLGFPMDGTGQLLPPGTPRKSDGKRKTVLRGGQKAIRKGRGLLLKRQVLAVVVGRQLSGPTAQALKLISKGVPIDLSDLPGAVQTPVPVPGAPA